MSCCPMHYHENIGNNLIHAIQRLYERATSAGFINGNIGEWFHTTVGVRQGCILSPTLFNIFLERIMSDVLEEHEGTVSIAGRTITNLRFADDIDGLAGSEQELAQLIERIDQTSKAYGMEINAEKTKLMTNNINRIHKEIKASDHKLQTVTNLKYLGAIISDAGSKAEMLSRIAQCTTTMTRLKPIWNDQNITLRSKVRLMRTLIISILLYACETWTLTIELERRIKAVEMRCYRRLLHISYKDHITNEIVCKKIQAAISPHEDI